MKILIFMKNWLGDILFQIPAIEVIKRDYPHAEIVCLAPSRCREMLLAHPAVSRAIVFDEKKEHRSLASKIRFMLAVRKEKADRVYLFHRSWTRAFLMFAAGVKVRIGYAGKKTRFLTSAVPEPENKMHQSDYFLNLLEQAGHRVPSQAPYHFYVSEYAKTAAEKKICAAGLSRFVCFHLGANWEPKRWPTAHFARLADLLDEHWHLPVVMTGAPADAPLAADVARQVKRARVISFVGQTLIEEAAALFQRALFLVSGDSGPMHIAAGAGASVVALFGPTDPVLTGPRGTGASIVLSHIPEGYSAPWYGESLPESGWLSQIQPERVLQAVEKEGWLSQVSGISQ